MKHWAKSRRSVGSPRQAGVCGKHPKYVHSVIHSFCG